MACPHGAFHQAVQRSLHRSGCRLASGTEHRRWRRGDPVMAIPRLEVRRDPDLAGIARLAEAR